MNNKIKTICIFASSSNKLNNAYFNDAFKLGCEIAKNGYNIVYGGSNLGLMGETVHAAKTNGAEIIGVMPEKLYNLGIDPGECTKFILTKGMRERKAKMDELSQATIALAGGFGTLEELSEIIVQKQLGYNNKPIVLLNTNGYYNGLINFFDDIINQNFAPKITSNLYYIANNPSDAVKYINNYSFQQIDYLNKKLKDEKEFAKNQPKG